VNGMARKKGAPIVEESRGSFKVGQYNKPLEGIKAKEEQKIKKWMETHKA
jgi:hypothetical protein